MTVLEWLKGLPWVPSLEGRDQVLASMSERRRQLQNRAWTITGYRVTERRRFSWAGVECVVEELEPIDLVKPGPEDPLPDVLAEVTQARGSSRQCSLWYDERLAKGLLSAWPEPLVRKYERGGTARMAP